MLSNDGDRNIVDSVDYIVSGIWKDDTGKDKVGAVMIQEEQIFAARDVQKGDDRPGGYVATGGHGGIVGGINPVVLTFLPTKKHTYISEVNLTKLPSRVSGVRRDGERIVHVDVSVKDSQGDLLPTAIPKVTIVKHARYLQGALSDDEAAVVEVMSRIDKNLENAGLSGFVLEGNAPYSAADEATMAALRYAALRGHARRARRPRTPRRDHAWQSKRPLHRRKQLDRHEGSSSVDGVSCEVRKPAIALGPRAPDGRGARRDTVARHLVSSGFRLALNDAARIRNPARRVRHHSRLVSNRLRLKSETYAPLSPRLQEGISGSRLRGGRATFRRYAPCSRIPRLSQSLASCYL